jgi:hypothetical protein
MKMYKSLIENLEKGDLKRLIVSSIHIDEYKSKMGDDADVCVVSFKVSGKEPSADLVSFIEKGYDWVLDADVSSGEKEDGDYLVFVELERTPELPAQIYSMVSDICNLTDTTVEDWEFRYQKTNRDQALSEEAMSQIVPLTPEKYQAKYKKDQQELDALKTAAGVEVTTTAPNNEFTESLRSLAGLR